MQLEHAITSVVDFVPTEQYDDSEGEEKFDMQQQLIEQDAMTACKPRNFSQEDLLHVPPRFTTDDGRIVLPEFFGNSYPIIYSEGVAQTYDEVAAETHAAFARIAEHAAIDPLDVKTINDQIGDDDSLLTAWLSLPAAWPSDIFVSGPLT